MKSSTWEGSWTMEPDQMRRGINYNNKYPEALICCYGLRTTILTSQLLSCQLVREHG